jgi:hypothetical protein
MRIKRRNIIMSDDAILPVWLRHGWFEEAKAEFHDAAAY